MSLLCKKNEMQAVHQYWLSYPQRMHNIKLIFAELCLNGWQVIKIKYAGDSEFDAAAYNRLDSGAIC